LFLCIVDAACVSREGGGTVTPLVLVSTAHVSLVDDPQYIQGAGDDEESWAMGLTPALFWDHHDHILEYASQDTVEERIREIVARDKQRRTQGLAELTAGGEGAAQQLHWIGRTGIAVADDVHVLVRPEVHLLFDAFEPHTGHAQTYPHYGRNRYGSSSAWLSTAPMRTHRFMRVNSSKATRLTCTFLCRYAKPNATRHDTTRHTTNFD
jgi:hypothetical protein